MANENKMQDVIATSLQNIKNLIDTNTVIGTPIVANGTTIIPISKIMPARPTPPRNPRTSAQAAAPV